MLPNQVYFPVGGEHVTFYGSKHTNSLENLWQLKLSTRTLSGWAPWSKMWEIFLCQPVSSKYFFSAVCSCSKNLYPLTPVPPVTTCDEPWPIFLLWCHDFWPKLVSSILNFCRWKRSFQWCPDQIDRPNGALDMHKNAQKVEWKTQSKISCHYTWLLHAKNCQTRWRFLRIFLTASKPSRRSISAAKRREKDKKERLGEKPKKKFQKSKSLKT